MSNPLDADGLEGGELVLETALERAAHSFGTLGIRSSVAAMDGSQSGTRPV